MSKFRDLDRADIEMLARTVKASEKRIAAVREVLSMLHLPAAGTRACNELAKAQHHLILA